MSITMYEWMGILVLPFVGLCMWMLRCALNREQRKEDKLYMMGFEGAMLAIRRGADANVVWAESQGPGSLNKGARAAASASARLGTRYVMEEV